MNKSRGQPTSQKVIKALVEKYPDVYEILGFSADASAMTPKKRQVLQLLDDINDDQETERVIAELEAKLERKRQK
jgi:hypothetical protein